jgi:hypothetical protein
MTDRDRVAMLFGLKVRIVLDRESAAAADAGLIRNPDGKYKYQLEPVQGR